MPSCRRFIGSFLQGTIRLVYTGSRDRLRCNVGIACFVADRLRFHLSGRTQSNFHPLRLNYDLFGSDQVSVRPEFPMLARMPTLETGPNFSPHCSEHAPAFLPNLACYAMPPFRQRRFMAMARAQPQEDSSELWLGDRLRPRLPSMRDTLRSYQI